MGDGAALERPAVRALALSGSNPTAFEELNAHLRDARWAPWHLVLQSNYASFLAVVGARVGIYLPYFHASMRMTRKDGSIEYDSQQISRDGPPAAFSATYHAVGDPAFAPPGALKHFLTERYSLYASPDNKRMWRA